MPISGAGTQVTMLRASVTRARNMVTDSPGYLRTRRFFEGDGKNVRRSSISEVRIVAAAVRRACQPQAARSGLNTPEKNR